MTPPGRRLVGLAAGGCNERPLSKYSPAWDHFATALHAVSATRFARRVAIRPSRPRRPDAGPRHRREHRGVQRRQRGAAAALSYPDSDRLVCIVCGAGAPNPGRVRRLPAVAVDVLHLRRPQPHVPAPSGFGPRSPRRHRRSGSRNRCGAQLSARHARGARRRARPRAVASQADQQPGGQADVMLAYGYWQRRFGGEPSVIGRTITVERARGRSWA